MLSYEEEFEDLYFFGEIVGNELCWICEVRKVERVIERTFICASSVLLIASYVDDFLYFTSGIPILTEAEGCL